MQETTALIRPVNHGTAVPNVICQLPFAILSSEYLKSASINFFKASEIWSKVQVYFIFKNIFVSLQFQLENTNTSSIFFFSKNRVIWSPKQPTTTLSGPPCRPSPLKLWGYQSSWSPISLLSSNPLAGTSYRGSSTGTRWRNAAWASRQTRSWGIQAKSWNTWWQSYKTFALRLRLWDLLCHSVCHRSKFFSDWSLELPCQKNQMAFVWP